MKYLAFLAVSVLVLIGAWLFLGPASQAPSSSSTLTPEMGKGGGLPALELPRDPKNHRELLASAAQLSSAGLYDARDCARVLECLVTTLGPEEWREASRSALSGWQNLVLREDARRLLGPFEDAFFDRVLRESDSEQLDLLLGEAAKEPKIRSRLTPRLDRLWKESPASPFEASRQAAVIFSFMRRQEYPKAQEYLARVEWPAGDSAGAVKSSAQPVIACVDVCERAGRGIYEVAPLIEAWTGARIRPSVPDSVAHETIRGAVEAIALRVVKPGGVRVGLPPLDKLLEDSRSVPHGEEFWGHLLEQVSRDKTEPIETRMEETAPLLRAFASNFKDPTFESRFWVDLSQDIPKGRSATARRIACFGRALEAAAQDGTRAELARKLSAEYQDLGDFSQARRVIEGTSAKVSDAIAKEALSGSLLNLGRAEEVERLRRRKEEERVERERAQARLSFMKDELARARREKKPEGDIQSLEGVVRSLERQVGE